MKCQPLAASFLIGIADRPPTIASRFDRKRRGSTDLTQYPGRPNLRYGHGMVNSEFATGPPVVSARFALTCPCPDGIIAVEIFGGGRSMSNRDYERGVRDGRHG